MSNNAADFIRSELQALAQEHAAHWGRTSSLLALVAEHRYWREEAATFTGWLDEHATRFGVKRDMLWRYLRAGHMYRQLQKMFPDIKPLEEVSAELSPENLELLAKISRAAPESVFRSLAEKLLSGEAKRSDLRKTWTAFRPILDGRTARGKGVPAPKASTDESNDRLIAALMLNELLGSDSSWTKLKNLSIYRVFPEVSLDSYTRFDAVAVTRGKTSSLMLHGVEIFTGHTLADHQIRKLKALTERCTMLWAAFPPSAPETTFAERIPESVGILSIDTKGIRTIRAPKLRAMAEKTEELTRYLLERALRG